MTATRTLYRKANVSSAEAIASLSKRFGAAALVDFEKKTATAEEAAAAKASEGELIYAATIRVAEFPPAEGGDEESSEAPEPKEEKKDEAPAESEDKDPDGDGDDDSSAEGDTDHDFAGKEEHGAEPKKLSPDEQIIHILTQILDALHGGAKDPLGDGPDAGLGPDLPDVGAPGHGDSLPPAGPAGPGGPPGKAPLPPPVKEKSPIGVGAFASVAGQNEVTMVREAANEVNNKQILDEVAEYAKTHTVARIQRTGLAQIGEDLIDLAEAKLALVTLVSR